MLANNYQLRTTSLIWILTDNMLYVYKTEDD